MPEGHKTHFLARRHNELLGGELLRVSSPQGRFADDAQRVDHHRLQSALAFGKHLFYQFDNELIVHVHLGRYGSFRQADGVPPPRGLVRMRMSSPTITLDLNGPTQCRVIDQIVQDEIVAKLGPDPLAGGRWQAAWTRVQTSSQPIGAILLDQSIIAGIGNIFRAEALFELGMNPMIRGRDMTQSDFKRLWKSFSRAMKVGLKHGSIITVLAAEVGKPLHKLDRKERVRVYGKTDCPRCGSAIGTIVSAARKLYVCGHCQSIDRSAIDYD